MDKIAQLGFSKCEIHQQRENTHRCNDCHAVICFLCVLSEQHKGHNIVPVEYILTLMPDIFEERLSTLKAPKNPYQKTMLHDSNKAFGDTNDIKKTHRHQTFVGNDEVNKQMTWSETITTKKLKRLLGSFKVDVPENHLRRSFAHELLGGDLLKNLVTKIKFLSDRIMLTTDSQSTRSDHIRVFKVKVESREDQLSVVVQHHCSQEFFNFNEDNITRVILIRSESLPIVEAKLLVYKKYKHVITKRMVLLHHELEDFDEVAKLSAYDLLSSFCVFLESLINALTIDFHKIMSENTGKSLIREKFRKFCYEVLNRIKYHDIGPVKPERDLSRCVADFIYMYMTIFVKGGHDDGDPMQNINSIVQNTVEDLSFVLTVLEDFQSKVLPENQHKQIAKWCKREFIEDKTTLQNHPSILQFIAGCRYDGKPVVKVYLRNDDKNAEQLFKKCSKVSRNTVFEFVNVEKHSKMISKEVEKINRHEKKAPAIDKFTLAALEKTIGEQGDKIYARYSNVIGIGISPVRCGGDQIQAEPCIVLYCLDKNIIPFGEKPLPNSIAGWPCDLREDLVMFGACPTHCPSSRQNFPEPGCSIGIPSVDSAGSVGFLVESTNPLNRIQCGFLTASHVAIERFEELYHHGSLLSCDHLLALKQHFIVHPSWQDNGHIDHEVGQVVESFCGNYGLKRIGMDFALVKNKICRHEEKETLPVANDLDLTFGGTMKVIKTGRTTGTTVGDLQHGILSVRVDKSFLSRGYFAFFNCYAIGNTNNEIFFREGDSGSGVFVIEKDGTVKPLGIAFAYMNSQTAVCRIDEIVNKLDLKIVKYGTSPVLNVPEDKNSKSMDRNKNSCSVT